ncbi:DUF6886 family protein [Nocardia sp. NPDC047038]|uniref:DUF6886 family protein n=1 Tax=Nocardia sp. NPDC047038 TaxID=3154338 RepID=UPI0033CF114B
MRSEPGEVLHFSEDPTISRFEPRVPEDVADGEAVVWAVDAPRCPDYWFPRDCPRAMAWSLPTTTRADRDRILGPGCGDRVHAIEYRWLEALRTVDVYAYRLPAIVFRPIGTPVPYAHVATVPVEPIGQPELVGDLLSLHERAGIQLRVLADLWPFWSEVTGSSLGYSGIRLHNAMPSANACTDSH